MNDKSRQLTRHYDAYDYELAISFQKDCERFLLKYENVQSLKFSDFAKIWQEMNFTYIYGDQHSAILLQQLCENCFNVVKKFIVFSKNIYTQVGAFYMLYGLYYKQPRKNWVKIRLIDTEYKVICDLVQRVKNENILDLLYIFAKMKVENTFLYVCHRRQLGPEERFLRSTVFDFQDDTFKSFDSDGTLRDFKNTFRNAVEDLQTIQEEYQGALEAYIKKNSQIAPFNSTLVDDLKRIYTETYGETSGLKASKIITVKPETNKKGKKRKKDVSIKSENVVDDL